MRVVVEPSAEGEFALDSTVLEARLRKAFEHAARELGCEVPCGAHFYKARSASEPRGGEMDVVTELAERMVRLYEDRTKRMLADVRRLDGDDSEG